MFPILQILVACGVLVLFVWLMWPSSSSALRPNGTDNNSELDPNDSRQLGYLIGLTGGDVTDALVARYALERFEEIHGRKATMQDVGFVVGLMKSLR
ncbi:MAG: hypothetical protein FJ267_04965 [Planctomycetes bacterium]|nr:hypothetical protein [Planctomycetota bacterium]